MEGESAPAKPQSCWDSPCGGQLPLALLEQKMREPHGLQQHEVPFSLFQKFRASGMGRGMEELFSVHLLRRRRLSCGFAPHGGSCVPPPNLLISKRRLQRPKWGCHSNADWLQRLCYSADDWLPGGGWALNETRRLRILKASSGPTKPQSALRHPAPPFLLSLSCLRTPAPQRRCAKGWQGCPLPA